MTSQAASSLALAGILACFATYAESDEPPQTFQLQQLENELKLNEQQKKEVGKIFDETQSQMEALRKQMLELRDKMRDRLKTVLTVEQMEKFDQLNQKRREQRRQLRFTR